jgi:hypothetical protein
MFGKSTLKKSLDKWVQKGGDLSEILSLDNDAQVKTKAEADSICAALDAIRNEPERNNDEDFSSPLHTLTAFFQQVGSRKAFDVLRQEGLPRLRMWVRDLLDGKDIHEGDVLFILKILSMFHQQEDVAVIAEAARKPVDADGFLWSIIFNQFVAKHPCSQEMIDALRDPLPTDFILVSYLDMANRLALAGKLDQHPFDSPEGQKHLEAWLLNTDKDKFSYAHSAAASLPFVGKSACNTLLPVAQKHLDPAIRIEAARVQVRYGDLSGLDQLAKHCLDPSLSHTAQTYLEELGYEDRIPEAAINPEFKAIAEMANWLSHPQEFGRPPDKIELFDTRKLFWPPTNDKRQLTLAKYTYNATDGNEPDIGVGMTGSTTVALFGETTADLSPEDIYGLHCCWELQMNEDKCAPEERSAKAGREILRQRNEGF